MAILLFFLAHWYLSIFSQTFFLHRYAAHGMFGMSHFWERFFFIFTFIVQGSSYLSATTYGILHRMHHAYADTEKDPHSPSHSDNLFDMMWDTHKIYGGIMRKTLDVEPRFTKNIPRWESFDRFAENYLVRILWGLFYIWFYVTFAIHWWMYLLLPVHFLMGPVHGVIINWFSHKIGYRNFESTDTSTNYIPIDILTMGEGYHNNHHKHSSRPNFGGVRWHELDPTWPIIKVLNLFKIINLKKAG